MVLEGQVLRGTFEDYDPQNATERMAMFERFVADLGAAGVPTGSVAVGSWESVSADWHFEVRVRDAATCKQAHDTVSALPYIAALRGSEPVKRVYF